MQQAERLDALLDRLDSIMVRMEDTLRLVTDASVSGEPYAPSYSQKDAKEAKDLAERHIERRSHELHSIVEAQIE